jgi:cell shape-determining protein MreC
MSIDTTAITHLEEKVEAILRRIKELKTENEALKQRVGAAENWRSELAGKEKELNDLKELLSIQDAERVEIRSRLEALLTKLEG